MRKIYYKSFLGYLQNRRRFTHTLNRALLPLAVVCICFLCIQFFARKTSYSSQNRLICTAPDSLQWKAVPVPGQTRAVRVNAGRHFSRQTKLKLILLWTKYFSEEYSNDFYFFQEGQRTFKQYNCEVGDCFVTTNRSFLPTADAVLFHARDFNSSDVPRRGNDLQIWILYSMEPPRYMVLRWKMVQSLFNWTMTYRSDSDVQVKYGEIIGTNSSCAFGPIKHRRSSQRSKGAIWMVSNCRTESRREAYVKELKKFFSVDVYGKCSRKRRCEPPQSEACYKLLSDYKFYLSFENSICKDYITEKFFNVLQYDIVPVVYGGADYAAVAPNNSFIDAMQFPNPRGLADHLKKLSDNDAMYERYFEWKSHYRVHLHPWMCDLCKRLHNPGTKNSGIPKNFWYWWIPSAKCKKWSRKKGFTSFF